MGKISVEVTEKEMRDLAEICAMTLSMLGQVREDVDVECAMAWQRVCVNILKKAKTVPSLARDMELNPDCGYWFFKRPYIDEAFYSDVLDEYRDFTFWSELVTRMAEQSLVENMGPERADALDEDEREAHLATLEKALWNEVTHHGIDRMLLVLPPSES